MKSRVKEPLNQVAAIVTKELKTLLRDRPALGLLFAMPAFFILVMSFALEGVFESGGRDRPLEVMVVNRDPGEVSRAVVSDLEKLEGIKVVQAADGAPLTLEKAEDAVSRGKVALVVEIREGFSESVLRPAAEPGQKASVAFIHDPATNLRLLAGVKGAIQGVVQRRVLLAAFPHRLTDGLAGGSAPALPGAVAWGRVLNDRLAAVLAQTESGQPPVEFPSVPVGGLPGRRLPRATEQNVPAYTIFGVFFIVLPLASSFLQEKKDGTFRRIMAAPLSKPAFLIGKLLPFFLVNLAQISAMFVVGAVFFGIRPGDVLAVAVVSVALALAANGLGLLVAALGKTEARAGGWAVLLAIVLSALGGMMVPSYVMPGPMKTLSLFTPHAWALQGYHDAIVRGLGAAAVLPETGVLLGFAAFFFSLGLWRFSFD